MKQENEVIQNFKFKNQLDEIKYFLGQYHSFENENYDDYFYLIPFEWLISWNQFITENKRSLKQLFIEIYHIPVKFNHQI